MKFNFNLESTNWNFYTEKSFSWKNIIFIYPKDMTPWCTIECQNFRDFSKDFEKIWVKIFWLSKEWIKSHNKFIDKEKLNFPLISDTEKIFIWKIWAIKMKNMFWKQVQGTERCTFIILDWKIIKEFRNVKVEWHVKEVLEFCKNN
jgi:peroxiredoxin Q/BCP